MVIGPLPRPAALSQNGSPPTTPRFARSAWCRTVAGLSSSTSQTWTFSGFTFSTPTGSNPASVSAVSIATRAWASMYSTPAALKNHGTPVSVIFTSTSFAVQGGGEPTRSLSTTSPGRP